MLRESSRQTRFGYLFNLISVIQKIWLQHSDGTLHARRASTRLHLIQTVGLARLRLNVPDSFLIGAFNWIPLDTRIRER